MRVTKNNSKPVCPPCCIYVLAILLLLVACTNSNTKTTGPAFTTPGLVISSPSAFEKASIEPLTSSPAITSPPASSTLQKTPSSIPSTFTPSSAGEAAASTPIPTLGPDEWKSLPIIPEVSDRVLEIYHRGLELGNNPYAFSKVGDCGSTPAWFLGDFDRGPSFYDLGKYDYLRSVILSYQGSFERTSLAARSGFNTSSLLTTLWTDLNYCQVNETPLACEYRLHRPVIAFITLGTNDVWRPEEFEPQMRQIIEYSIENGVIPILATKADNAEGDSSINRTIASLAQEYQVPLWNYWLAVQPLPGHGLQDDNAHLTWGSNFFNVPENLTKAWTLRNLTALQVLNQVWLKVTGQSK